jgi:alpha-mannosidase
MLKLESPTALTDAKFYAKVPGEVLERSANGQEEPYQDWGAVTGKVNGSDYTVALLNNSTYSYDCLDGLFRTVLIRSAPFARHNPGQVPHDDNNAWQDQGRQERRFWLLGARGLPAAMHLDRRAEELQTPAEYVMDSGHAGTEPWERSLLEVSPANVWVLALKQAEGRDSDILVRVQERSGVATTAMLRSVLLGLDQPIALKPWELKTMRIARGMKGAVREVSLLEV